MRKSLIIFFLPLLLIVIIGFYGCGGGGAMFIDFDDEGDMDGEGSDITEEDIPGIIFASDDEGNTIESGSTGIIPKTLIITLEEKDGLYISSDGTITVNVDGTATNVGNISLTCGSITPTISVAASETVANQYIITVSEPWRIGCMSCTLSVVATSSEIELEEAFSFQNACAVSDDFNTILSLGWIAEPHFTLNSWSEISYVATANTDESTLDVDFTGYGGNIFAIYKEVYVEGDFSMHIRFKSAAIADNSSAFALVLTDPFTIDNYRVQIGKINGDKEGNQFCSAVSDSDDGGAESIHYYESCDDENIAYDIRLTSSDGEFTHEYKAEGDDDYTILTKDDGTDIWEDLNLSGDLTLKLFFESTAGGVDEIGRIDYIEVTGMTVEGQY